MSKEKTEAEKKRQYISQADVPRHSLEEALRIPRALWDNFAGGPARPLNVAQALDLQPSSSHFRTLTGAAIAYGLSEGGYNSKEISLTPLGQRIVAPTVEGDDQIAKRAAFLQPRIARQFFTKYDSKPLPRDDIARNVLVEMGVGKDAAKRVLDLLIDNAKDVGCLETIKGSIYVDLAGAAEPSGKLGETQTVSDQISQVPKIDTEAQQFVRPKLPTVVQKTPVAADGPLRRGLQVDAYILQERLGSGFSAEVWSALVDSAPNGVEVEKGQLVAIKFYHSHAMALPDQVIRVEREYRIASRIRHPNLIRIFEFLLASSRPNHNFLVMDVARGETLRKQILPVGISVQKTLKVAQQLLSALDELHSAGALHRDVKPGNIAYLDDATGVHATLLDLGIVSVLHERGMTAASRFIGSKHWAPYEQLVGEPIDQRSDLYSVGAVIYNMLTGDEPYAGKGTEAAVAVEMAKRPLRLPDTIKLPETVREMINACLSTDAASRPLSAKSCLQIVEASL